MKKRNIMEFKFLIALFLIFLIVTLPISFAEEASSNSAQYAFPGLPAWLIALLVAAGYEFIAIGVAVIAGGYIVYRIAESTWLYYTANKYSQIEAYAYKHQYDFPYELGNKPSKSKYKDFCKNVINRKYKNALSYRTFIQKSDGKLVVFAILKSTSKTGKGALVFGKINGKTIADCYPVDEGYVNRKVNDKKWSPIEMR